MRRRKPEYSKRATTVILGVALFDVQLCIISTFFDKVIPTEIAVSLIAEVIGVCIAYFIKAFLGKKAEEETRLKEKEGKYADDKGNNADGPN